MQILPVTHSRGVVRRLTLSLYAELVMKYPESFEWRTPKGSGKIQNRNAIGNGDNSCRKVNVVSVCP